MGNRSSEDSEIGNDSLSFFFFRSNALDGTVNSADSFYIKEKRVIALEY